MVPVAPYGPIAISRAVGELRVHGEFSLRFVYAQTRRVAIGDLRHVLRSRWRVRKLCIQGCIVGGTTILTRVTAGVAGAFLSDVGGVNELRGLLNCISHDPLHEREGEIHCWAPASLTVFFFDWTCRQRYTQLNEPQESSTSTQPIVTKTLASILQELLTDYLTQSNRLTLHTSVFLGWPFLFNFLAVY